MITKYKSAEPNNIEKAILKPMIIPAPIINTPGSNPKPERRMPFGKKSPRNFNNSGTGKQPCHHAAKRPNH